MPGNTVKQQLFGYFLDQLGEDDRRVIEQRYIADDAYFDLVATVEEELIVSYLDGRLSKGDHVRFEEVYSTCAQREKVATISRLRRFAKQSDSSAPNSSSENDKPSFFAGLLWFEVTPSAARGANEQTLIEVARDAGNIGLRIELDEIDEYESYEARLKPAHQDVEMWHADGLRVESFPEERYLRILVPSTALAEGDHVLYINGIRKNGNAGEIAAYTFSVSFR